MIQLGFGDGRPLRVLCLGAHSDDIEIGCGGLVSKLAEERPDTTFEWAVFSASGIRGEEAERGAELMAGADRITGLHLKHFQDGFMPFSGAEVKACFEEMKQRPEPDLILTHTRDDAHQDHRLICELTWNTFRNHFILEYEIPKYDGDMGRPNVFVPLTPKQYRKKVETVMSVFQSQRVKHWFCTETFMGLMRLRGMECSAETGYAEAFYCRKAVL